MPNNLSVNKGTEDSLLYDSRSSLFQRQGYSRASNFQVELVWSAWSLTVLFIVFIRIVHLFIVIAGAGICSFLHI